MWTRWIVGCALLLMASPVWAINPNQLVDAENTLRQINGKVDEMREFVQVSERGKSGRVVLTGQQRVDFRNNYDTAKTELQTLVNSLP